MEELERGAEVDGARVVGVAAGADEGPVEEGGSQSLAAGEHERAELGQRHVQVTVDEVPPLDLGVEQTPDPGFDRRAHDREAGRDRSQHVGARSTGSDIAGHLRGDGSDDSRSERTTSG